MKKLIIAAAIVCAAAVSHGAALLWGMNGITKGESSVSAGAVAYFMDATTWADFSAALAEDKAEFCANNYTYTGAVESGRSGMFVGVTSGTYQAGDSISGYVVVFDTAATTTPTYYANTAVTTVTAPGMGNAQIQPAFSTTTGWTATPEPTSAILMLLGVAGLALKRKQK